VARRAVLLLAGLLLAALPAAAQAPEHRAGLVVRFPDGSVQTRCVAFDEPSISGEQLLERSGFTATINPQGALGGALCSLNGQGCTYPAQDCFCRCTGPQCEYWAYYHWTDGEPDAGGSWQYSTVGASSTQVKDGSLEGWSWGPGNFSSGTEPPKIAFGEVCKAGAAVQAPAASSTPPSLGQYAGFGVVLAGLLAAALAALRRPRGSSGGQQT
jgi:hypothetical protein